MVATECEYKFEQHEAKFQPPGVRWDWVGEDGLPNQACIDAIKRSNKKQTEIGMNKYADWAYKYKDQLEELCWWLPRLSDCDKAKLCFSSAMAASHGPILVRAGMFFLNLCTQVGLHYIQEWYDIEEATRQMMWASRCCEIYCEHAREQGWIQ
jgi:hypothetical protein